MRIRVPHINAVPKREKITARFKAVVRLILWPGWLRIS